MTMNKTSGSITISHVNKSLFVDQKLGKREFANLRERISHHDHLQVEWKLSGTEKLIQSSHVQRSEASSEGRLRRRRSIAPAQLLRASLYTQGRLNAWSGGTTVKTKRPKVKESKKIIRNLESQPRRHWGWQPWRREAGHGGNWICEQKKVVEPE